MNKPLRARTTPTALTAALSVLSLVSAGALLAASGCTHDNDPNAAPYGTAASPSAPASAATVAVASPDKPLASASPLVPFTKPSDTATPSGKTPVATGASGAPAAPPLGGMAGGMPMMGMGGDPNAPMTPTPDLDAKIADAVKSGKQPAIAAAYAARGTSRMNDANGGARIKYRMALADYRDALKADPANEEAKKNKDLIEGIYKQMGRPIPE